MKSRTSLAVVLLAFVACQDTTGPMPDESPAVAFSTAGSHSLTVYAEADATVISGAPSTNFGSALRLHATPWHTCGATPSGEARSFARFDLSGVPPSAVVLSATLQMTAPEGFAFGGDGNTYVAKVANDSWDEGTITWNTRPVVGAVIGWWWIWSDYPCSPAFKGDRVGSTDVTAAVQAELAGDAKLSIQLFNNGYWLSHYSREHGVASQVPQILVEWEYGNPTSKESCKNGGWADYGFRNQGQCVRYIETGKDSR